MYKVFIYYIMNFTTVSLHVVMATCKQLKFDFNVDLKYLDTLLECSAMKVLCFLDGRKGMQEKVSVLKCSRQTDRPPTT